MNAPAPGTSSKLLIVGGASAGVGLLLHLVLPLTYGSFDSERSYDDGDPWEATRFGFAVTRLLGTSLSGGGIGLADLAVILGAISIALAIAVKGFEPKVPRPVAPQGYPQGSYSGQYAQPQPGQYAQPQAGQYPAQAQSAQAQPAQDPTGQPTSPPDQGGYQQQPWSGSGS